MCYNGSSNISAPFCFSNGFCLSVLKLHLFTELKKLPVCIVRHNSLQCFILSNPWGVAVNERNEIAVTEASNHRVQVFSSDGTYLYLSVKRVINRENLTGLLG